MEIVLSAADINSFSPSTKAELKAFVFPKSVHSLPPGFGDKAFEKRVDLSPGDVEEFMRGCADITVDGLRVVAEKGPCIHASELDKVGIDNYGQFQGSVTKRTRTVTRKKDVFLFAWDDWNEEPDGIGHYAVTDDTFRSLRVFFGLE